ncbi:YggS family pyridoxal phosphate-dependent enzyme [Rothia sp. AR01]|uniref:Pyridoxal phosphate homeostasis protein n=2 Tax=Rothia santali TaxID=2949643 RepID=A0A9X2HD67_9MICC|nr:YggS family pyridoxal phosphate-dependent enzyme [Rothia santali]
MDELRCEPFRARELTQAYRRIEGEVAAEAARVDPQIRPADLGVELLPVTKFFPASDVAALYDAGVRVAGENRDQEASAKAARLAASGRPDLRWHYIGQLQTNKAKSVVSYATSIHSVDRRSLVDALAKAYRRRIEAFEAGEAPAPPAHAHGGLECLLQVNLEEGAEGRGGAAPGELAQLADAVEAAEGLRLGGLMAVAPLGAEPGPSFERLWELSQRLREDHPRARHISAGMSGDWAEAIGWGSTRVRLGSSIMGPRPAGPGGA